MGGIISKPKAPKIQPLPAPVVVEPVVQEASDPEAERAERRRQNLLRRERGVLSTVKTSLSGVLSASSTSQGAKRKTLLGE